MARRIVFTDEAWSEYLVWQRTDRKILQRLNGLIEATARDPFVGIGKPEPLRGDWRGFWSRRIDDVHRLVYEVQGYDLVVAQCRYHYDDH
jgi:toxin YoeB